jgi:GH24 family phage-related lysozyme (muramidase)
MKLAYEEIKAHIVPHEGVVSHMYLDTVGKVTVGVGNMVATAAAAAALAFVDRATRTRANEAQIRADFESVSSQPKAQQARQYKLHTKLDLPDEAIWTLLKARVDGFEQQLIGYFPQFPSFPSSAQLALLDMAFNLGGPALNTRWPSLKRAVLAQDWRSAQQECERSTSTLARNNATRLLFQRAAEQALGQPASA